MSTRRGEAAVTGALLLVLLAAATTSMLWRPSPDAVATWWPAAGVAAALLARRPRRSWPVLLVAVGACTTLASLVGGRPLPISVLMGLVNATEALVVAAVVAHVDLRRLTGRDRRRGPTRGTARDRTSEGGQGLAPAPADQGSPATGTPLEPGSSAPLRLVGTEDYVRVLLAAVLGALTTAVLTALATHLVGEPAWASARTVAPSHLAAVLVILPLALVPVRLGRRAAPAWEVLAQVGLLVVALVLVFVLPGAGAPSYLPLPLLVWAALRLSPYAAALEVTLLAVVATASTTAGRGPFAAATDGRLDSLLAGSHVQGYLVCAAVLAVPTALASAQRRELTARLRAERELSTTVLDTTATIIFVTDPAGTILHANATLTRLTGFTVEDVVGRPFWECALITPERHDTVRRIFAEPDGSNVPAFREADVQTRTGERLRVVWSNNVVRDEDGRVLQVVCTATDVTSERSTSGLVRHLLEAPVATALVALDERGHVFMVNHGAEELLGRTGVDLAERPVTSLVSSSHPGDFMAAGGTDGVRDPETHDWTWVHADGTELLVSTTISEITNVVGKVTGYLCVGRDVTEQRRTQAMLVAALRKERHVVERLQRLDAAKNDFVSTVSHELRTPTTSIVGYTEMLREGAAGSVTPGQEVMLDAIARNGERLITVASDLLTLAGLESTDATAYLRQPVDLTEVLTHAREAIHPLLSGRDLRVEVGPVGPGAEPVVVTGDPGHLDRVAMNLLSNAVKFTPDGGTVTCDLRREGDVAVLEVADTGIGIPTEEQDGLFTKFFRSSTSQERAIQGTGLGLSIIHSIVTAHGGTIEVRSAHEQGTTFTVRLPLAPVPAALPDPDGAAPLEERPAGLSVG